MYALSFAISYWLERICRFKHKWRGSYKGRGIRRQISWCHFRNYPPQMGSSLSSNQWVIQLQNPILGSASSAHYPY